jgi:hypothetical protein
MRTSEIDGLQNPFAPPYPRGELTAEANAEEDKEGDARASGTA